MPPKKAAGKKNAAGYKMPAPLSAGTVLNALDKKQWVLGKSVGTGGFGVLYLAKEQGGKGQECVVKIEPHENGPLFVEMHYYLSAGKAEHLADWKKGRGAGRGIPHLPTVRGNGSYMHGDEKYRFLVIDKLGQDLDKIFKNGAQPLDLSTAARVAVQVLDCLEYIHSRGYTHNDVKASNLLAGLESNSSNYYLVDFGLVVKFMKGDEGAHKEYKADPRKAHDGTIEYLSRDAHIGCTARRSDLENLALCLVHWTTGKLPWLNIISGPPTKVQTAKEQFFDGLPGTAKDVAAPVKELLLYVRDLEFEEVPNYEKCRAMFAKAAKAKSEAVKNVDMEEVDVKGANKKKAPAKKVVKNVTKNGFAKTDMESEDSSMEVDEDFSPPTSKKRARKGAAKNIEDSPNSVKENTPINKKQPKRKASAGKQKVSTQTQDSDSEEDMFAVSPAQAVLKTKKYSDTGSQTSPAFVAASKAARRGKAALAKSEGSSAKVTPRKKSALAAVEEDSGDDGMENPTPAMAAILQKRQVDKTSKKVSKTEAVAPAISTEILTPAMQAIIEKRQAAEEAGTKRKKPTGGASNKKTKI